MRPYYTTATLILLVASVRSFAFAADDAQGRTWKDATGVFSVVGELVDVADGKVRLKLADGKVITVDIDKLSSADQQYISSLKEKADSTGPQHVAATQLTGKPQELKNDDGTPAGRKSFPRRIAFRVYRTRRRLLPHFRPHSRQSLRGSAGRPEKIFTSRSVTEAQRDRRLRFSLFEIRARGSQVGHTPL